MQNDMRDRLVELITEYHETWKHGEGDWKNGLADHLIANGVIAPPCKVNDTVYVIFNGKVHKATVFFMKTETQDNDYLFLVKVKVFEQISLFKVFIIGTTAFLTKDQAEQKLKEMRVENG